MRSRPARTEAFRVALGVASAVLVPAPLAAQDTWVNPGSMGPNALPTEALEAPGNEGRNVVRLGVAAQWTNGGDRAQVPVYRLEMPFGRFATMLADGRPVESWHASDATRAAWGLERSDGVSKGDIRFGAKFLLFDGGDRFPSVATRTVTKTTTGKSYGERRFTNAPAYLLDLLVAQPLGRVGGAKLTALASVGFFAWQQGRNGQNDAPAWAGGLRADGSAWRATAEVRGYSGWETADKPVVVGLSGEAMFGSIAGVWGAANAGLRDAPAFEAMAGLVLKIESPLPMAADEKPSESR